MTTPERRKATLLRYRQKHKEQIRAYNRRYRAVNRDCRREYDKEWLSKHPGRAAEYRRKYRAKRLACNDKWLAQHPGYMFRWYKNHPGKRTEYSRTTRASRRNAFAEHVDLDLVAARDHWRCGICGLSIRKGEESLDHIIPVSRGGKHEYSNVQLAHTVCNLWKGARILRGVVVVPPEELRGLARFAASRPTRNSVNAY
jgi:5-methylcytosine-specific restriction endonuclease McrA